MLLVNVYFPTRDKETLQLEFLKLDESVFDQCDRDYLVLLGGDFNSILDGKLDYVGPKTHL